MAKIKNPFQSSTRLTAFATAPVFYLVLYCFSRSKIARGVRTATSVH